MSQISQETKEICVLLKYATMRDVHLAVCVSVCASVHPFFRLYANNSRVESNRCVKVVVRIYITNLSLSLFLISQSCVCTGH